MSIDYEQGQQDEDDQDEADDASDSANLVGVRCDGGARPA